MKVYIVEAHSYDDYARVAVCASIDKAKEILKAKADELTEDGGDIDWDLDGLGFDNRPYGDRYAIIESDRMEG